MALKEDDAIQLQSDMQCIGPSELFDHAISGSHVHIDCARTYVSPLHEDEEISTSKAGDKTFLEQFRRARTATKIFNERIAVASGTVCLVVYGLDGFGTIFARAERWAKECNRDVFLILLLKNNEHVPNQSADLFQAWSSSGFNVTCSPIKGSARTRCSTT